MKDKIVQFIDTVKKIFKKNPIYLAIAIVSIIVLIIGIIAIGFLKTILFLILVDGILILSEYQTIKKKSLNFNNYQIDQNCDESKQNRSNEEMTNEKEK